MAVLVTPAYAFLMTAVLLKLVGAIMPLRASDHEQAVGMDVLEHGEEAYASGEGAILITPYDENELGRLVADPA